MTFRSRYGAVHPQVGDVGHGAFQQVPLDNVHHGLQLTKDQSTMLSDDVVIVIGANSAFVEQLLQSRQFGSMLKGLQSRLILLQISLHYGKLLVLVAHDQFGMIAHFSQILQGLENVMFFSPTLFLLLIGKVFVE